MTTASLKEVGLEYARLYYTGVEQTAKNSAFRYEVMDPPCFGEQGAFIVWPHEARKEKAKTTTRKGKTQFVTVVCPFTLKSYQMTEQAGEFLTRKTQEVTPERLERLIQRMRETWDRVCRLTIQGDFANAAAVFTRLGVEVPRTRAVPSAKSVDAKPKGKPPGARLLKQVDPASKRGKVAEFFMEPKSLLEAMAQFGMTRSGVLTHLHGLAADHGLGYELIGDTCRVILTADGLDPFGASLPGERAKASAGKPASAKVEKLPEKGKRRDVALATYKGMVKVAGVAAKVGCSEASVRSHLHDLHTKHGLGYELSADRSECRLLTPKGWKP